MGRHKSTLPIKSKAMIFRTYPLLADKIKEIAKQEGKSITELIEDYINSHKILGET